MDSPVWITVAFLGFTVIGGMVGWFLTRSRNQDDKTGKLTENAVSFAEVLNDRVSRLEGQIHELQMHNAGLVQQNAALTQQNNVLQSEIVALRTLYQGLLEWREAVSAWAQQQGLSIPSQSSVLLAQQQAVEASLSPQQPQAQPQPSPRRAARSQPLKKRENT